MTVLENEEVRLRALEPGDVDLLYDWENDSEIWLVSNTITPFSKHILHKYIESAQYDIYQNKQLRLMIDSKTISANPITIGSIDLFDYDPFHHRAGIGVLISDIKYRNKGYASAALEVLIKYCFSTLLLHQVYCNITSNNENSIKLFTSQNFQLIGEKKDWIRDGNNWLHEQSYQLINPNL